MRLFSLLSGDDVFISYSRKDGALYAAGLADKLTEKGLSCFIDKLGTEPDHDLPSSLKKKIRSCTIAVIIGTEKAAQSEFVEKEIIEFKKTERTILPIDFNGHVANARWYDTIPGLASETEQDAHALETGNPSLNVLNFVEKSFKYTRRNQHMFRMFWGAASIFLLLVALSLGGFFVARDQIAKAADEKRKADEATGIAEEKQREADAATLLARQKTEEAKTASDLAKQQTELAAEKTTLADEKTKIADAATERATAQTKIADAATRRAAAAEQQEAKGRSTLSENYYSIAQTSSLREPLYGLPWAQKAIAIAPENDENLNTFKLWTLNLTKEIPKLIINPPGGIGRAVVYSPRNDKVVIVSPAGKISVWNLTTGQPVPNPLDNCGCKPLNITHERNGQSGPLQNYDNPIFSPDGKYLAVLTEGLAVQAGNFNETVSLHVWEAETGRARPMKQIPLSNRFNPYVNFRFSSDSKYLLADVPESIVTELAIAVWKVESGEIINTIKSQAFTYYPDEHKRQEFRRKLPVSDNPKRNWIVTFEGDETTQTAVVKDFVTGQQQGEKLPLEKTMEYINFTGGAGRIVTIFRQRDVCEVSPDKKRIIDTRMISAWSIESNTRTEPEQFAMIITQEYKQEYKIIGFSKDDNTLIVDHPSTTLDLWGLNERRLVKQIQFMASKKNLKAFFSDDEKKIITIADNADASFKNFKQDVFIIDVETDGRKLSTLNGTVNVSSTASTIFQTTDGTILIREVDKPQGNIATSVAKLPIRSGCFVKAFPVPNQNQKTMLTLSFDSCEYAHQERPVNVNIQLWDLQTGKPKWNAENIPLETTRENQSTLYSGEVVFDSTGKKFATIVSDSTSGQIRPWQANQIKILKIWDTNNGSQLPNFSPVVAEIHAAAFNQDGSQLTTIEAKDNQTWVVRRRNVSTGELLADNPPLEFDIKSNGYVYGLSKDSRFAIFVPADEHNAFNEFIVRDLDQKSNINKTFSFNDDRAASLAIELLKKADALALDGEGNLKVEFEIGFSALITNSGNLNLLSKNGISIPMLAQQFNPIFESMQVGSDGKLILKSDTRSIALYESRTRLPVIENLQAPTAHFVYSELLPANDGVLTIETDGEVRLWKIGAKSQGLPFWLNGIGEALSGMNIKNDISAESLLQEDYLKIRRQYVERLTAAAQQGDSEAQLILNNWNP